MSRKNTVKIDWDKLTLFAETCEAILCTDQKAIDGLYAFLGDIEAQYPEKKALTKVRQEIRASIALPDSRRLRCSKPRR